MTNSLWKRDLNIGTGGNEASAVVSAFMAEATGEMVTSGMKLTLKTNVLNVGEVIEQYMKDSNLGEVSVSSNHAQLLVIHSPEALCMVAVDEEDEYSSPSSVDDRPNVELPASNIKDFNISITGSRGFIAKLRVYLGSKFENHKYAQIKWWYLNEGRTTYESIYLEKPKTILLPEFYPDWGDPEAIIKDYLNSDESILLLAGDPGTGKTTLLRHMIYEHNLGASVVYDEELMQKDTVFQKFLFDDGNDILVIEDADVILQARESENNKLMSRFLNISDGLIKLPNKKLVFTTNLTDFSKIDKALMRPGRCYGVLHTRALTYPEAVKAAEAAGLPAPSEERPYTLAELFKQKTQPKTFKMGFLQP